MIDITTEQAIGLHEASRLYPSFRNGRPTHISTPLRHITRGVRLSNGQVVRLEGARLGGRWITTIEAVERFMQRLTAGAVGSAHDSQASTTTVTTRRRRQELDRVDRELSEAGF
jgi:hypothetical protein